MTELETTILIIPFLFSKTFKADNKQTTDKHIRSLILAPISDNFPWKIRFFKSFRCYPTHLVSILKFTVSSGSKIKIDVPRIEHTQK